MKKRKRSAQPRLMAWNKQEKERLKKQSLRDQINAWIYCNKPRMIELYSENPGSVIVARGNLQTKACEIRAVSKAFAQTILDDFPEPEPSLDQVPEGCFYLIAAFAKYSICGTVSY